MEPKVHRRFSRAGKTALLAVLGAAIVVAGGAIGFKYLFNRPGEAAVKMIPQDAMFVVTLDTNPGPNQLVAFQKLREQLQEGDTDKKIEQMLAEVFDRLPVPQEIRPHLRSNFAFCVMQPGGQGPQSMGTDVAFLGEIDDESAVLKVLEKHGAKSTAGRTKAYTFAKGNI